MIYLLNDSLLEFFGVDGGRRSPVDASCSPWPPTTEGTSSYEADPPAWRRSRDRLSLEQKKTFRISEVASSTFESEHTKAWRTRTHSIAWAKEEMIDSTENGVATKMWRKKVMEEKESQQNAGDSILKDMWWV